jgi:SAM-dependent methyltransferase
MPAFDYSLIADLYDSFCRFEEDIVFFRRSLHGTSGPVLELMSGTGRVSIPLIEDGLDLVCVDLSLPMLEVLRTKLSRRSLRARLVCCDVKQLPFKNRFPVGIWPFHGISELAARHHRRQALRELRQALADGAALIVTVHNPPIRRQAIDGEWHDHGTFEHASGRGSVSLASRLELDPEDGSIVGIQRVEEISEAGRTLTRREFPLRFALPSQSEMEDDLRDLGFVIDRLFGDYDANPFDADTSPHLIWKARAGQRLP